MTARYWSPGPATELSQCDLLAGVWIGSQFHPRTSLVRGPTVKGGGIVWHQDAQWKPSSDGLGHYLARGRQTYALVLSQSCEIDKRGGKSPVLVAPVVDLAAGVQDVESRERIRAGRRYAFFPLEGLPGVLQESYVDFRAISYVPRAVLDEAERPASATESGLERLSSHLVAFFTRISLSSVKADPPRS